MANPHHEQAQAHAKAKMKALTGFAKGGRPHSDAAQDRKLFAKALHEHETHFHVHKSKSGGRLDKYARGGKAHKPHKTVHNHVTVVAPAKVPVPGPGGPPPGAGGPPQVPGLAARPPVPTAMPPPGMGAGPVPSPAMRKHGGFVKKYNIGGAVKGEHIALKDAYARGGSIGQPADRERGTLGRGQIEKFLGLARGGKAYIEGEVPGNEKKWAGYAKKDSYAGAGHFARGGRTGMPPKKVQPIMPTKKAHFGVEKPTDVWANKHPKNRKPGKLAKVEIIKKFGQGSGMGLLDQSKQLKKRYP